MNLFQNLKMLQICTKFSGLQKSALLKFLSLGQVVHFTSLSFTIALTLSGSLTSFDSTLRNFASWIFCDKRVFTLTNKDFVFLSQGSHSAKNPLLVFALFGTVIRSLTLHSLRSSVIRRSLRSAYAKNAS